MAALTTACVAGGVGVAGAAPTKPRAKDQALANSAVLHITDMPVGWTSQAKTDQTQGDQVRNGISDCKRYQASIVATRKLPQASSQFGLQNQSVQSQVLVFPKTGTAQSAFAVANSASTISCLQKSIGALAAQAIIKNGASAQLQGVTGGQESVPQVGDQSVAYQFDISVSALGLTTQIYEDAEFVRVGRIGVEFAFGNPGSPPPTDLRNRLMSTVIGRLGSTAGSTPTTTSPAGPLFSQMGHGIQTTTKFSTPAEWQLKWHYDCSNSGGRGNFIVTVKDPTGTSDFNAQNVNELGPSGDGTQNYHADGGEKYLDINSECDWSVTALPS